MCLSIVGLRCSVLKRVIVFVHVSCHESRGAGFSDFESVWVTVFALVVGQLFHGGAGGPCRGAA